MKEWLTKIVEHGSIGFLKGPVRVDGKVVVTDGRGLLRLDDSANPIADVPEADEVQMEKLNKAIPSLDAEGESITIDFQELKEFCGPPAYFIECKECNGDGSIRCYACDHEAECEKCDGRGVFGNDRNDACINSIVFNRSILSRFFHHLEADTVKWTVINGECLNVDNPVLISADKWTLLLCPIDDKYGACATDLETLNSREVG